MTPESLDLELGCLEHAEVTLYRLAKAEYANFSGIGAAMYPGRWNRVGQEAIYTSVEQGVPVLEKLAHTNKNSIPKNLAMMEIQFTVQPSMRGSQFLIASSLAEARRVFEATLPADVVALAVPSVIIPVWNVVLYPQAPDFWRHISLRSVESFEFDPRLFPAA